MKEGKKSPIINILTAGLPYKLARQIYNEHHSRLKEAKYLISNYEFYETLKSEIATVELLLALSIFHKRVISNLDGAVKFHGTVSKLSDSDTISIGSYDLTSEEKNRILSLLISYRKLIQKYDISEAILDYYHTKDFVKSLKYLKSDFEYEEGEIYPEGSEGPTKDKNKSKEDNEEDDIPF